MGATGAVTKIDRRGRQSRDRRRARLDGEHAAATTAAIGPHGIMVVGDDTVIITNGGPTAPRWSRTARRSAPRETLAAQNRVANLFGRVLLIGQHGRPLKLADI